MHQNSKFITGIVILLSLLGCSKNENPVPVTSISYKILSIESDPRYINLRSIGNSAILETGGTCVGYNCNGVILYRQKNDYEYDDFKAFDRTCPNEVDSCAMEIDEAFPYLLICPCCGSIFNMEGGYMESGPAGYPLREFDCDFYNGDLRIY